MDEYYHKETFSIVIYTTAGVAIIISCLGCWGDLLFCVQRTKEIGIRKVLGTSVAVLYICCPRIS